MANSIEQQKYLQFLRTSNIYDSKELAKQALLSLSSSSFGEKDCDGTPVLARYKDGSKIKTLIGICYKSGGNFSVTIFDDGTQSYWELQKKVSEIVASAGLEVVDDVITYVADPTCDILDGVTTIKEAIDVLGHAIDDLEYSIQQVDPDSGETEVYTKYELIDNNGIAHGSIAIPKDRFLKSAELVDHYFVDGQRIDEPALELTFITADGTEQVVDLPVKDLIDTTDIASDTELKALEDAIGGEYDEDEKEFNLGLQGETISGANTVVEALEALDEKIMSQKGTTPIVVDTEVGTISLDFYDAENAGLKLNDDEQLDVSFDFGSFEYVVIVANTAEDVNNIANPSETTVILNSEESLLAASNKTFKSIVLENATVSADTRANATENVTIKDSTFDGAKGASNGKILFNAPIVSIENVVVEQGSTIYNVFEGNGSGAEVESFNASKVYVDDPALRHNVFNIYRVANDAVINVSDCDFNLNVANSNALRLANYTNSTGVTVNFTNVNWTYENAPLTTADLEWAGLIIYQPASADKGLVGDLSYMATWTFNFTNCKYNGVKVDGNNFKQINQVMYLYNVGNTGACIDPIENGLTLNFN